jgi:hypothetical protein
MYEFAVVALLGLATYKLADLLAELVPGVGKVRTLATFAIALVGIFALDYSVFEGFGITVREPWLGIVMTGLIVGSLAAAWQALLGFLGSGETGAERPRRERPRIAA